MIDLYTLAPDRLNLNGDQANLLVLQKRLAWLGVESRIIALNDLESLEQLRVSTKGLGTGAFLLLGHGSAAAMRSLSNLTKPINNLVAALLDRNVPVLAVGSSYELLVPGAARRERLSDFVVEQFDGFDVLGYANTDADLSLFQRKGSLTLTMLHGPVLAKNPRLADEIIANMGVTVKANDRTDEIDAIVAKAWELEANH